VSHPFAREAPAGPRAGKTYRGSRRRVDRVKMRGNGSRELWILVAWVTFLLLVVVPWMMHQGR
jgi:hypothetical protein